MNHVLPERRHPVGEVPLDISQVLFVLLAGLGVGPEAQPDISLFFRLMIAGCGVGIAEGGIDKVHKGIKVIRFRLKDYFCKFFNFYLYFTYVIVHS